MMTEKQLFGAIAVVLALLSYLPYFHSLFKKRTHPHLFSWVIWALVSGIVFFAQYRNGAGAGSWATGFIALCCILIAGLAVKYGEKNITRSDWIAFGSGLFAVVLWCITKDPLWAVVIATAIDVFAFYPTLRKSFTKPWEESALSYGVQFFRAMFVLAALENYSFVTALLPSSEIFSNFTLTAILLWRRMAMKETANG